MTRIYPVLALVACANVAYAQDNSFLPDAKIPAVSAHTWNVGAGVTQKLLHTNLEWMNPYGIAYAKAGVFINDDYPVGGQLGFRFPVHFTGKDKNGYYLGVYAGHIDSKKVDAEYESRLGGGVDLAYVLLSPERISTFSVGIGAGEKLETKSGDVIVETEPRLQFSYTLSFGL